MTTIPSRSWTTQAGPSATAPVGARTLRAAPFQTLPPVKAWGGGPPAPEGLTQGERRQQAEQRRQRRPVALVGVQADHPDRQGVIGRDEEQSCRGAAQPAVR